MKSLISLLTFFFALTASAGTAMKIEGSCSGNLQDGTAVSFTYYSNFDGCREKSSAAVSFSQGMGGSLYTGKRAFIGNRDVYSFKVNNKEMVRLSFADSTGNTGGKMRYVDMDGKRKSIAVTCEIRDYEYAECGN